MDFYKLILFLFASIALVLGIKAASLKSSNSMTDKYVTTEDVLISNASSKHLYPTIYPDQNNAFADRENETLKNFPSDTYESQENPLTNATELVPVSTDSEDKMILASIIRSYDADNKNFHALVVVLRYFIAEVYTINSDPQFTINVISNGTLTTMTEINNIFDEVLKATEGCKTLSKDDLTTLTMAHIHSINSEIFKKEILEKIKSLDAMKQHSVIYQMILLHIEFTLQACVDQVNFCAEKFRIVSGFFIKDFVESNLNNEKTVKHRNPYFRGRMDYLLQYAPDISAARAIGCIPSNGTDPDASVEDGLIGDIKGLGDDSEEVLVKNKTKRVDKTGCSERFKGYQTVLV